MNKKNLTLKKYLNYLLIALFFILLFSGNLYCQSDWEEVAKFLPPLASFELREDQFGVSVEMNEDVILVGAPNYKNKGGVYIFANNETQDALGILTASDGITGDRFGGTVGISNNTIVVRANNSNAYVFEKPETGWQTMTETARLTAEYASTSDQFGISLGISNDVVVVNAIGYDSEVRNSGCLYVFAKPETGWKDMHETAKLERLVPTSDLSDFGISVAIDNDIIVAGAYKDKGVAGGTGAVYVFVKPETGWTDMTETAKLVASDGTSGDYFGKCVDIMNNEIVVGAPMDAPFAKNCGSVYVFTKPEAGWTDAVETAKLKVPETGEGQQLGTSVKISDNVILAGLGQTYNPEIQYNGAVYIFKKAESDWKGDEQYVKLTAPDGGNNDKFGLSVDIYNDKIIAGAPNIRKNGINTGAAYLFSEPLSGWSTSSESDKLLPLPYLSIENDHFGTSVAISDEYLIIGAPHHNYLRGAVYIYSVDNTIEPIAVLSASDGSSTDLFGQTVCIDGNTIVVGAHNANSTFYGVGSAYVYEKPQSGWKNMTETARLDVSYGTSYRSFGSAIDIDNNTIVVASYVALGSPSKTPGAAFVYEKPATGWVTMTETARLTATDATVYDLFAKSVGISNNTIAVGAVKVDGNETSTGAVYVYEKPQSGWESITETVKLTASDGSENDNLGSSVAIDEQTIVAGAPGNNSNSIYLFEKPQAGWGNSTETKILSVPEIDGESYLGRNVDIMNNVIVATELESSAVYVFEKPVSGWSDANQSIKLTASDGTGSDLFANAVCVYKNKIAVGANYSDDNGTESGAAYLYETSETVSGASHKNTLNDVNIYPNPGKGEINVELGNLIDADVRIFSTDGNLIYQNRILNQSKLVIHIDQHPGIYFVEIASSDKIGHFKYIKIRE